MGMKGSTMQPNPPFPWKGCLLVTALSYPAMEVFGELQFHRVAVR